MKDKIYQWVIGLLVAVIMAISGYAFGRNSLSETTENNVSRLDKIETNVNISLPGIEKQLQQINSRLDRIEVKIIR